MTRLPLLAAALLLGAGIVTGMWLSVRLVLWREPQGPSQAVPDGGWPEPYVDDEGLFV